MNANLAALAYLVSGVLFILALRGPLQPGDQPARQPHGHDRHGHRHRRHPARRCGASGALDPLTIGLIAGGVAIGGDDRRGDRPARAR